MKAHIVDTVGPVAKRYNLSVDAFGKQIGDAEYSYGQVILGDAFGTGLEPAPITPSAGNAPYDLLSGTIRNVLTTSTRAAYENKTIIVAPSILLGEFDSGVYDVVLISSPRAIREHGYVKVLTIFDVDGY